MNLLELDCYSLCEIIRNLDIGSHKNIVLTCKKLHMIAKNSVNIVGWRYEIQKEFVKQISLATKRNDMPGTMKFRYSLEIQLKALLRVVKYIEFTKLLQTHTIDLPDITLKLINKSIETDQRTSLKKLATIGYYSQMKINHWLSFKIQENLLLYICNVNHPESFLEKCHDNPLIAIIHECTLDETWFYCYNVMEIDWFAQELGNAKFSKSKNVLDIPCMHLKTIVADEDADSITPTELIKLGTMNFLTELNEIKSSSNVEHERIPCIFQKTNVPALICNMKQSWHDSATRLLENQTNFINLIETFCKMLPFDKCSEFVQKLIESIQPFFRVNSIFGYGELLAYYPVVQKLLPNIDICSRVNTSGNETVSLLMLPGKDLKLSLIKTSGICKMHIFSKDVFDFIWTGDLKQDIDSYEEYKLFELFEEFIEKQFSSTEISSIPNVTLRFIFSFLTKLFLSQSLDGVDLNPD